MAVDTELDFKNYYQEELYMVADVETGILYNRSGRRMLALTDDFLVGLHRALEKECGDEAKNVIHACGRNWGKQFGEGLTAEWSDFYGSSFREFPLALFQSLLIQEFGHNGWGVLDLNYQHYDKGIIWLSLRGAIMADLRSDTPDAMSDAMTAGILGGMYSFFLDRDVDCVQTQSESQGHAESRFAISSRERIEKLRAGHGDSGDHEKLLAALIEIK